MSTVEPAAESSGRSTAWVGGGLALFGAANFIFLALLGRDLGPAESAPVGVAWTALNALGIGLFQPMEQECSRRLAAARATGRGANLTRALRIGLFGVGLSTVVAVAALPWIAARFFGSLNSIVFVLICGLAGQALAYYARGALAGTNQFGRYGAQLGLDGALRILFAIIVFVVPGATATRYAIILVLAPVLATVLTARLSMLRDLALSDRDEPIGTPLAALVAASLAAQLLANFGPLAVAALATAGEQDLSGRFVAGVTIARIPLFVFAAIQAVLLPTLSRHLARGDDRAYWSAVRTTFAVTAALAIAGIVGLWWLGPWAMRLIYGPEFDLSRVALTVIAASGGAFMLAQLCAQMLLAQHLERQVALGWGLGLVAALAALSLRFPLDLRVAWALTIAALVAFGVLGALVLHARSRYPMQVTTGMTAPKLSVIMLAYGAEEYLPAAANAILQSTGVDLELIVVDNGCTSTAVADLPADPRLRLLVPGENLGFTGGVNLGAREVRGEFLATVNSDAIVDSNTLATLVEYAAQNSNVGIVGATIVLADDPDTINSGGNPLHVLGLSWAGRMGQSARALPAVSDVTGASGACLVIRTALWRELGGFSEPFFAYFEDLELSWRCHQRGLPVRVLGTARAAHYYEFSRSPLKMYLVERNRWLFLLTCFERRTLLALAPPLIAFELGISAVALAQGWGRQKLQSWRWLIRHRDWIRARRDLVQQTRTVPDGDLVSLLTAAFDPAQTPLPKAAAPLEWLLRGYWAVIRPRLVSDKDSG